MASTKRADRRIFTANGWYYPCAEFDDKNTYPEIMRDLDLKIGLSKESLSGHHAHQFFSRVQHQSIRTLTRGEEYHLFRKYNFCKFMESKSGSKLKLYWEEECLRTRDVIVAASLRLIADIAMRYAKKCTELYEDMYQEACMHLPYVIQWFDYTLKMKFSTLLTTSMRRKIAAFIRVKCKYFDHEKTETAYLQDGASFEEITELRDDDSQNAAEDRETVYTKRLLRKQLRRAIAGLAEKEQYVLYHWLGWGCVEKTFRMIAAEYGCTYQRISQIKDRALQKLRDKLGPKEEMLFARIGVVKK